MARYLHKNQCISSLNRMQNKIMLIIAFSIEKNKRSEWRIHFWQRMSAAVEKFAHKMKSENVLLRHLANMSVEVSWDMQRKHCLPCFESDIVWSSYCCILPESTLFPPCFEMPSTPRETCTPILTFSYVVMLIELTRGNQISPVRLLTNLSQTQLISFFTADSKEQEVKKRNISLEKTCFNRQAFLSR